MSDETGQDITTNFHAHLTTYTRVLEFIPSPPDIATAPREHANLYNAMGWDDARLCTLAC
jgi:hypothetical protein